jgi:hypothetical protein
MTNPALDEAVDPPLDAAQLKLQRKLGRLLFFSSLIMALGLIAVFAAILYRVYGRPSTAAPIEATVTLPAGARVVSTVLDGERMLVTVDTGRGTRLLVVDVATLTVLRTLDLKTP